MNIVTSSSLKHSSIIKHPLLKEILKYKYFYILLIPPILFYVIFSYGPMYGATLAFKDFAYNKGILHSPWVGIKHFKELMNDIDFWIALRNTVNISLGKLLFHFPTPILLAILLNEMTRKRLKGVYQTIFTFPHFISWVVISGIITNFLGETGFVNQLIALLGGERATLLTNPSSFRPIIYISHIWKEIGWDSIIYLASLSNINLELYEAAAIDGANRFHRIIHITWPGIRSTVVILFILAIGNVMNAGFEQVFNLYNPSVYSTGDIIDTYVYRRAFVLGCDFSFATAVGLFKSVINFIMLFMADRFVKGLGEDGIF